MKTNESIKRFQTEEGFVFTEQELQSHIETQNELNDFYDIVNLPVGGSILIDTIWIKRLN